MEFLSSVLIPVQRQSTFGSDVDKRTDNKYSVKIYLARVFYRSRRFRMSNRTSCVSWSPGPSWSLSSDR